MSSSLLKTDALILRRKGFSYSEIGKKMGIPKSTLSGWLRHIKPTKEQESRLRKKSEENRKLGSKTLLNNRIAKTEWIIEESAKEVEGLTLRDLWFLGIVLYWAEGSKQKVHDPSKGVIFSNSDPLMIKIFLKWLTESLKIAENEIVFEIYIHETYQKTIDKLALFWSKVTGLPVEKFKKVYFKKNKVRSFRKNRGPEYNGVLRVSVKRSTDLNRKITGWIKGIVEGILK